MSTFVKTRLAPLAHTAVVTLLLAASCTDPVDIDSAFEEAQPVVDAWLTDESVPQTVFLWQTQDYFANQAPTPLTGAVVQLTTLADSLPLTFEELSPGAYTWTPAERGQSLASFAEAFTLRVEADVAGTQRSYSAASRFRRVPQIDSIAVRFEEDLIGLDDGLYAQVYARDLPGVGDRYLIRSTINDTLLNRPGELNLAADAAFDGGTASDGITLILPIRFGVNKLDDDGAPVALESGDSISVEIWSLTEEAFRFLSDAQEQILNADAQLFSVPVVSTRGNVTADGGPEALGMFSLSRVSRTGRRVE